MSRYHDILKQYWGFDSFRLQQEQVIEAVTQGQHTLAVLPTGGGKSICYQVPTLAMSTKCIVISPLIALMKDQVLSLHQRHIKSYAVYTGMSKYEINRTLQKFSTDSTPFLFLSPERLQQKEIDAFLEDTEIGVLAVDEAHCISQWGYDFRPAYLLIGEKRELMPQATVIALTASATAHVKQDIVQQLHMPDAQIITSGFSRSNIAITCKKVESKISTLSEYMQQKANTASSLVYCNTRFRTKELCDILIQNNIAATYYNGGMQDIEKNKAQHAWMQNEKKCMVCTNAFGMGIDKPDVRYVVHYDTPESPEAYYQEIGRAGRDGVQSQALLIFNENELGQIEKKVALRFPPIEKIKKVYQHIMSYCQIAYEEGEDEIHPFDLDEFCSIYHLQKTETYNCLKILEQNNYWKLSEGILLPAKVRVLAQLYELNFLEQTQPHIFNIIQALLRLYGGILTDFIKINPLKLAEFTQTNTQFVVDSLQQLHHLNLIEYVPAIDKPYIYFYQNRVREYEWRIDTILYTQLKERYSER